MPPTNKLINNLSPSQPPPPPHSATNSTINFLHRFLRAPTLRLTLIAKHNSRTSHVHMLCTLYTGNYSPYRTIPFLLAPSFDFTPAPSLPHPLYLHPSLVTSKVTHLLPINAITAMPRQNRQFPFLHFSPVPFRRLFCGLNVGVADKSVR
jgi:hypothetical protein